MIKKRITLESLTLRNWRGEKERTTSFHIDAPTFICGDNGLGKSRHFDAFCWLLFGKDSRDRKNYELRTYDAQHQPLHHCECSVEGVLIVDDECITLKREWHENWVKPRGQVEEKLKNNETLCTWNGTPLTMTKFDERVKKEIIDDTLFKMLTNPHYFVEQTPWKDQRDVLTKLAGEKSYEEFSADNADFRKLLTELSGKPLADFRREIAATKKRLKDEADKIPARIDEVQRGMPEAQDWTAINKEIETLRHDIDTIDHQLQDRDARREAKREERNHINKKIDEAQEVQRALLRRAKTEAQTAADHANEYRRGLEAALKACHSKLTDANIDTKRCEERIKYLTTAVEGTNKELEALREKWYDINATAYDKSSNICPTCGQALPEDVIAAAYEKFQADKAARLAANNAEGKQLAEQRTSLQKELEEKRRSLNDLQEVVRLAQADVDKYTAEVMATPVVAAEAVDATTTPDYVEQQRIVEACRAQLAKLKEEADAEEAKDKDDTAAINDLTARKADAQTKIDALNARLAKREVIADAEARLKELQDRGRDLAQQIADIEKQEYVAAQLSKAKIEDCEQRLNGMFTRVRFKLFDYTMDGGEVECCVPLVDGVPYAVANTASQLNAGLDIINTLCRFNNVCAPIFIDGAESVNHYLETPSQCIFLQVTTDKEIVIR